MIETIIFDIGNVLMKVQDDNEFYRVLMQRLGLDENLGPEVRESTSLLRWAFSRGKTTEKEFYKGFLFEVNFVAGVYPNVSEQEFYNHWNGLFLGPNDSMVDVVNQLKDKKYYLQVLSNINKPWLEFAQKNYPHVFAPFDDVVASCAEDVGEIKGSGLSIYWIAHCRNGAEKPSDCIFIDDKLMNVWEGYRYGFNVFHNDMSRWNYEQATERFRGFLKTQKVFD